MTQDELDFLLKRNPALSVGDTRATTAVECSARHEPLAAKEVQGIITLQTALDIVSKAMHGNCKLPILLNCKQCSKEFVVSPPSMAKSRKYCSLDCAYQSGDRIKHIQKKDRGTRVCMECEKKFQVHTGSPNAKCCSRQCNGAMIGRTSLGLNRRKQPVLCVVDGKCKMCSKPFRAQRSSKRIYCSMKCSADDPELKTQRVKTLNSSPKGNSYSRSKNGWETIGRKRFFARSSWESNYARFLEWKKQHKEISDWEHEPHTFWFEKIKRGVRSYLPDFKVTMNDGSIQWHEVKGWMDGKSKTKIRRMAKYHPQEILVVIDQSRYRSIAKTAHTIVPGWTAKGR